MKLDISYPEMALLRELINKEKLRLWHTSPFNRKLPLEKIKKLISEMFCNLPDWLVPTTNEQCIARLLDKFYKLEMELQNALKKPGPKVKITKIKEQE